MGQDFRNFTFGGSSDVVIVVFIGIIVLLALYIAYRILSDYLKDKKQFGWIYELANQKDFTKTEVQDLKEVSAENQIKNVDQLYRVIHSVKMLSSTRRKLLFETKEKSRTNKKTKRPVRSR